MNPDDLARILDALSQADVREFSLKTGDYELSVRRGAEIGAAAPVAAQATPAVQATPAPQTPAPTPAPVAETPAPAITSKSGSPVKAPIVGTFYASPSPDQPAYVKVGDRVEVGQVLCIIEAMKLMNEIESEAAGTVQDILVKNAEPVEYGQTLFVIG